MTKGEGTVLIGLGHKARHGKDYSAEYIKELLGDKCAVLRFSETLYEECTNLDSFSDYPLIIDADFALLFLSNYEAGLFHYILYTDLPVSMKEWTSNIFKKAPEGCYWGMEEKDPILLQWWGTDFRRKYYGDDYWVNKIKYKINNLVWHSNARLIVIPDVRFKNEYDMIKKMGGIYIDVQRLNEDETPFIALDRDPNHESEIDLDNVEADYVIKAVSGDMQSIKSQIEEILIKEEIWEKN